MKKALNPPKFDYEPIDFKRRNIWLTQVDGYQPQERGVDIWLWCSAFVALIVVSVLIFG